MRLFIFLFLPLFLFSQNTASEGIALTGRYNGEKVLLRWAPGNIARLREGMASGYYLDRMEVDSPFHLKQAVRLTPQAILPVSQSDFEKMAQAGNHYAAAAAEVVFGKKITSPLKNFDIDKAALQSREGQADLMAALLMADWNAATATALGLRFEDHTALPGKRYLYRLTINAKASGLPPDTATLMISTFLKQSPPPVPAANYRAGDRAITIYWEKPAPGFGFSGYFIERSEDGGHHFHRTTEVPYIFLDQSQADSMALGLEYFTDSVALNYQTYYYRVIGLDAFGETSIPGNIIAAYAVDMTPPSPPAEITLKQKSGKQVSITWKAPTPLPADFGGYLVSIAHDPATGFRPLFTKPLPKEITQYTDTSFAANLPNYYKVTALDTALNMSHSEPAYFFYKDETPPASPWGLTGHIDTSGKVTLHWHRPADSDILGYTIEKANAPDHEFTVVTTGFLSDTLFYDSLSVRTLSKKIYYRVLAHDLTRNSSRPSAVLELNRPDKIPPAPPAIEHFEVTDSSVFFSWISSPGTDITKILILKKQPDGVFKLWKEVPATTMSITDKDVMAKNWYEYALIAEDNAGLKSESSFPLRVRVYQEDSQHGGISQLAARLNADKTGIVLTWFPGAVKVKSYLIYREFNNKGLEMFQYLDGDLKSWTDTKIGKPGVYRYALKAKLQDGTEGKLTDVVIELK